MSFDDDADDHAPRPAAPPSSPPAANSRSGVVISLRHYRLARTLAETGRQQGELARMLRAATAEREQLALALKGAQRRLLGVADTYRALLGRLERERLFRDACRAAAELDDLDEMIRRRDELTLQLDALRRDGGRRAGGD